MTAPVTEIRTWRGYRRWPEYTVAITIGGEGRVYRVEAKSLDHLADIIEAEVRAAHPNRHVGVRLDTTDGTVWVRVGFTPAEATGTWGAVS